MKHKIGFNRLDRMPSHRKALHRNMVTSLFRYERVITTKPKALEVRRTAEKMITRAKEDSIHNRRMAARVLYDEGILAKLYADIGPRMKERMGGYTRILKLGFRQGDGAELVVLELVDRKMDDKQEKRDKRKAERKAKEAARKEEEEKKAESKEPEKADVKAEPKAESKTEVKTEAKPKAKAKSPAKEEKKEEPEPKAKSKAKK
jgi:large subunit ribosomal protein L17